MNGGICMSRILISINPEHVKNIINGSKKFEYRTKAAKKDIDSIIIYSTFPTKKIVAEVTIDEVLSCSPDLLWEQTKDFSGISKEFFDAYFDNRKVAYAYKLGTVKVFDKPQELSDYGVFFAPQSFVYI